MQMPESENLRQQKRGTGVFAWILGLLMVPFLFIGACFAAPYVLVMRWRQQRREDKLKSLMKSQGRFMGWAEFQRTMRESGGTCIEERFSAKGPVRFWWTQENVYSESPHESLTGLRCARAAGLCRLFCGAASAIRERTGAAPSWWRRGACQRRRSTRCGRNAGRSHKKRDGLRLRRRRLYPGDSSQ